MKKILFLSGSPRSGSNSRAALESIADGVRENLSQCCEVEFIDVPKLKLSGCVACDGCKKNGGRCVRPDESAALMEKVATADVLILGTPVYWWGISSQLKMAIDKFYSKDEAFHTTKKQVGVVAVGAAETTDRQYELIRGQFECITEFLGWELIFCESASAWQRGELAADATRMASFKELWKKIK